MAPGDRGALKSWKGPRAPETGSAPGARCPAPHSAGEEADCGEGDPTPLGAAGGGAVTRRLSRATPPPCSARAGAGPAPREEPGVFLQPRSGGAGGRGPRAAWGAGAETPRPGSRGGCVEADTARGPAQRALGSAGEPRPAGDPGQPQRREAAENAALPGTQKAPPRLWRGRQTCPKSCPARDLQTGSSARGGRVSSARGQRGAVTTPAATGH